MDNPKVNIRNTPTPTGVCGTDERVQVDPKDSPPYNWICYVRILDPDGKTYRGSGFKINIPWSNRSVVVTAGHNVYNYNLKAYAERIWVSFPGQDIEVETNHFYAAPEYVNAANSDYDYGIIILPTVGGSHEGFGWSLRMADQDLDNRLATLCGYPGDKPANTLWITGGAITRYTTRKIFYMKDSYGGNSGSPVYTWYKGYWTVLAIHTQGGCPNSAVRFTYQMISRFLNRMGGNDVFAVRSTATPNIYLRCFGSGVTGRLENGGGVVNAQFKPPSAYEKYYLRPIEVPPSLAEEGHNTLTVSLESVQYPNVFIRLDPGGMNAPDPNGGGTCNCQYTPPWLYEHFVLKEPDEGRYCFQSITSLNRYLRLYGFDMTKPEDDGGGKANCQWSDSVPGKSSLQSFTLEKQ